MSTSEEQTTAEETNPEVAEEETPANEAEATEEAPKEKPEDIENAVAKGKNISTLTAAGENGMPEGWFDNYGTPDLRTYLKFWESDRSIGKAEQLLRDEPEKWAWVPTRDHHIKALREEISLREAKRSQGGPGAGPKVQKPEESTDESTEEASDPDSMTPEELEAATAPAETA